MTINGWNLGGHCPICKKEGGCAVSRDGMWVACKYVDDNAQAHTEVNGKRGFYIHRMPGKVHPAPEFEGMANRYMRDLTGPSLIDIAGRLKVDADTLKTFGLGWCEKESAWTIPVRRPRDWSIVCLWLHSQTNDRETFLQNPANRAKLDGFFGIETPFDTKVSAPHLILAPRGLQSTVAAASLGFNVLGRSSYAEGSTELLGLMGRVPVDIVVIPDRQGGKNGWYMSEQGFEKLPGWEGPMTLCQKYLDQRPGWVSQPGWDPAEIERQKNVEASRLRLAMLPRGVDDLHAWVLAGAGEEEVGAMVAEAPVVTLGLVQELQGKLMTMRKQRAEVA